jgi:gliding motility-associated-like protein
VENFACDPALANGEASAVIYEGTTAVPAAGYTLEWFAGKNVTVGPVLGTAPQLTNQMQGDYTLLVVDNTSPNRGCSNYASLAIDFDPTSFSLAVAATDQNLCAPAQNGSVMLTGITEVRNGVSTPIADPSTFEFLWTDEVGVPHPSTPAFTAGVTSLSNLLAGKYHVQVRNAVGCVSSQTAGVVRDLTVLPVITLENFENPVVCLLPETPGYLQVSADHSLNFGNYTFEWFEGPDDTGTLVEPNNPTLDNVLYSSPLEYTVRVTNLATQCVNHDTYRFAVDTVQIQVLASATARASCLVDDGTLFATTVNGIGALYNYEWYSGPTATGTPVYTTKDVAGAPIGQYTVIAVHPTLAFCQSTSYTTRVSDGRVMPPVVAVQRNPLTYCDPANPNGVAFASVNDEVNGYVFDWYQGDVGGTSFYTGPEVSGLTATTYVVQATHVVTGCQQTASITIDNDPVNVPEPTVVVVSHHTNCVVPDGILQATVGGTTLGYILNWYNGNGVKPVADAEGEFYRDLERGFYTTTATDIVSGCVSDPVVAEILPFQELPDFDIVTKPTNCEQNIGEAMLVLKNNVDLYLVEWHIGSDIQYGTMLSDLPKGEFTVIATTYAECSLEKSFEIRPEILVFNGISRNNDGQNDFFEIACIEDFPQNNVKIFNRAGTLVYEANGYDNQDVLFDGVSNRGISLLGTDLPDGTYFYIIDKRDGSEPKTGYLELLR